MLSNKTLRNTKRLYKNKNKNKNKKRRMTRHKNHGGAYWDEVVPQDEQIFAYKNRSLFPKKDDINECSAYNDKTINIKYKVSEIPYDSPLSPIHVYKVGSNYADLEEGIHNFILFWDDRKNEYILATSLFNPYEYASKHYMMGKRLGDLVPNSFIFSGEFKKEEGNPLVKFHDISSLYFIDNLTNFKTVGMAIYFLKKIISDYVDKNGLELERMYADRLDPEYRTHFNNIKQLFLTYYKVSLKSHITKPKEKYVNESINNVKEFVAYLKEKQFSKLDSLAPEYINYLKRILKDAFNLIFGVEVNTEYVEFSDPKVIKFTDEEYGVQKDRNVFVKKMCEFNPAMNFDLYADEESCKKQMNKIGDSCAE